MSAVTSAYPRPIFRAGPYNETLGQSYFRDSCNIGSTRELDVNVWVHGLGEWVRQRQVWTLEQSKFAKEATIWRCPDSYASIHLQPSWKKEPYSASSRHWSSGSLPTFEAAVMRCAEHQKEAVQQAIDLVEKFAPKMLRLK